MTRSVYQFYTRKETGEIIPNAEVTVNFAGGAEAPIFTSESGGVEIIQPLIGSASGKAVFYAEPGVYDIQTKDPVTLSAAVFYNEEISTSRAELTSAKKSDFNIDTTESLISKVFDTTPDVGTIFTSKGYSEKGAGGAPWIFKGVTGQTASQSPAQLGDALLNDGNGNQWALTSTFHHVGMLGALGDSITDDRLPWVAYLYSYASTGCYGLDGKVYGISGNLTLPVITKLKNSRFSQLNPAIDTRTLVSLTNVSCELSEVHVNRGSDKNSGSLSQSGGIWIAGGEIKASNISVTGDGFGSAMSFHSFDSLILYRPTVYDTFAGDGTTSTITDDVFQGIWLNLGVNAQVYGLSVTDTIVEWSGQAPTTRYNRGVAVGGTKDYTFHGGVVDKVGQGWDFTGDQNSSRFSVIGAHAKNCYSWGFKAANTVTYGQYLGCHSYRSDLGGFVASAPGGVVTNPSYQLTQNISYIGCNSIDTGIVGNWTGLAAVSAFRTVNNVTDGYSDYPRGVKFINCIAENNGGCEYGFFNEVDVPGNDTNWVEAIGCESYGATSQEFRNLNTGFLSRTLGSNTAIASGVITIIPWDNTVIDGFSGATTSTQNTIRRKGVYSVKCSYEIAGNASGTRKILVYVNGAAARKESSSPNASATSIDISYEAQFNAGDIIDVRAYQDSGVSLDIQGGNTSLTISEQKQLGIQG